MYPKGGKKYNSAQYDEARLRNPASNVKPMSNQNLSHLTMDRGLPSQGLPKKVDQGQFQNKGHFNLQSQSGLNPIRLNLHLSNLSETVSEKILLGYFTQFGKVVSLNIAKLPNGLCRGFCKLTIEFSAKKDPTLSDQEFAARLVANFLRRDHIINGSRVNVEEHIGKKQRLAEWDDQLIKCRISVRNIPEENFDDSQLDTVFRQYFGNIRNAYIRQKKSPSGNKNKKPIRTQHPDIQEPGIFGFVTFEDEKTADLAALIGGLVVVQVSSKISEVIDLGKFMEINGSDFFKSSSMVEFTTQLRDEKFPRINKTLTTRFIQLELRKFKSKYKECRSSNQPKNLSNELNQQKQTDQNQSKSAIIQHRKKDIPSYIESQTTVQQPKLRLKNLHQNNLNHRSESEFEVRQKMGSNCLFEEQIPRQINLDENYLNRPHQLNSVHASQLTRHRLISGNITDTNLESCILHYRPSDMGQEYLDEPLQVQQQHSSSRNSVFEIHSQMARFAAGSNHSPWNIRINFFKKGI